MARSFFRKLVSQVKSSRKSLKPRTLWSRPNLETLDERVLPSVSTVLNGSVLKVIANPSNGTTQVEIIQSNNQIVVDDSGQLVNSFDINQVQQIDFKYRELQHQHSKFILDIPVTQGQMNLTGFAAGEVDLNLMPGSLTAGVSATLPDSTALSLTGTVDNQGNYDLTGTADIAVDGFALPGASFELTNASMAVAGTLTVRNNSVNLAGTLDSQGNYNLAGTADIAVGSFTLPSTSFQLTNTSISAATTLTLGSASLDLSGTLDNQGNYDLTGTANVTVAGFPLSASFELTNTGLTVSSDLTVGSASLNVSGTVDPQGNYDLTGTANVTVAGFPLSGSFELTNTNLTVTAALTIGSNSINLAGTVDNQGQYTLTGTSQITVASFDINAGFTLTNTSLAVAGTVSVGGVNVNLAGTVDNQGNYTLAGATHIIVAGFDINAGFTLTNTKLAVAGTVSVGAVNVNLVGTVDNQGNYALAGTGSVTLAGFSLNVGFTLTNTKLAAAATVTIGAVNINLAGMVTVGGQYSLTGTSHITVSGWGLDASFTLTNTSLTVAGKVLITGIGTVNFAGTVTAPGNYSLTATTHLTISGFGLDATLTLTNTSLTIATSITLPSIGQVNLSGTINAQGQFTLTASVSNLTILFVTITNASVTLTNTSLTVAGTATGIPLLGTVTFSGTVSGGSYTFTATLPSVTILGFTLTNLTVTLNSTSLSVSAHAANLPLVGAVDFSGTITATGFTLTATATNVDLLGFIHFASISLTLNSTSLSLSATTTLPVVGTVTFTGTINFNGTFTISATAPHFTLLGFIGVDNATVSLSFPNPTLRVSASINLAGVATASFTGTIGAGGTYSFTGSASLNLGGFTLGTANMQFGNMSTMGIQIGPFTTPPLPVIGAVTLSGSYSNGSHGLAFSFLGIVHGPVVIGGIPFTDITVGFEHDSQHDALTLGAGVGIVFGGLTIANAAFLGTVSTTGDFKLTATVTAFTVAGFSAAQGVLTLQKTGAQVNLTLHATANLIVATLNIDGFILFATGQFSLTGTANVSLAGFSVANVVFTLNNSGVALVANIDVKVAVVHFIGAIQSNGNFLLAGTASVGLAGFPVATASFTLRNSGATFSAAINVRVATINFSGSVNPNGSFTLAGSATVSFAGFVAANASFSLTNSGLTVSANVDIKVATVHFSGSIQSNGNFSFAASASLGFVGFGVNASITLSNSGVSVSGKIGVAVLGLQAQLSGSIQSNGTFSLTASASLHLGPLSGSVGFTLNNGGFTAHATGTIDLTAHVSFWIFSATVGVRVNVDVSFGIATNGTFSASGNFQVCGYLVIGGCWSIGFTMNNHQLRVLTSGIGFSLWGVGFHPFGDVTINY